jgi:hypothetical protein
MRPPVENGWIKQVEKPENSVIRSEATRKEGNTRHCGISCSAPGKACAGLREYSDERRKRNQYRTSRIVEIDEWKRQ